MYRVSHKDFRRISFLDD